MDLATEETYAVVEPSGDAIVGLDGLVVKDDILYAAKGRVNMVSAYQLSVDAAGVVSAMHIGDMTSDGFDNLSTIDIVGDMLYNANTRSISLPFPYEGETDPSTATETFTIAGTNIVLKMDTAAPTAWPSMKMTASPTLAPVSAGMPNPSPVFFTKTPTISPAPSKESASGKVLLSSVLTAAGALVAAFLF